MSGTLALNLGSEVSRYLSKEGRNKREASHSVKYIADSTTVGRKTRLSLAI
jgi:hypothetical protein